MQIGDNAINQEDDVEKESGADEVDDSTSANVVDGFDVGKAATATNSEGEPILANDEMDSEAVEESSTGLTKVAEEVSRDEDVESSLDGSGIGIEPSDIGENSNSVNEENDEDNITMDTDATAPNVYALQQEQNGNFSKCIELQCMAMHYV